MYFSRQEDVLIDIFYKRICHNMSKSKEPTIDEIAEKFPKREDRVVKTVVPYKCSSIEEHHKLLRESCKLADAKPDLISDNSMIMMTLKSFQSLDREMNVHDLLCHTDIYVLKNTKMVAKPSVYVTSCTMCRQSFNGIHQLCYDCFKYRIPPIIIGEEDERKRKAEGSYDEFNNVQEKKAKICDIEKSV
jgi:hypothetical protein